MEAGAAKGTSGQASINQRANGTAAQVTLLATAVKRHCRYGPTPVKMKRLEELGDAQMLGVPALRGNLGGQYRLASWRVRQRS